MNNSGTVCQRNILVAYNVKCFFLLFFCKICRALIQWFVLFALQICSFVRLQNFVCALFFSVSKFAENGIQKRTCHIISIAVGSFHLCIIFFRIYTKRKVGRKCPWRCCPCQDIRVFVFYFKSDDRGTFFYVFVSLCHFLCGKRSSAARAVRYDLKAFVEQTFIPDLF